MAILDADKEGFLRNNRSLIQTIGRAARNVSGQVIMYADRVTDSMRSAIDETNRRRERQVAYNTEHGIEPQTIRKAIPDIVQYVREGDSQLTTAAEAARELAKMPRDEVLRLITSLEEDMATRPKRSTSSRLRGCATRRSSCERRSSRRRRTRFSTGSSRVRARVRATAGGSAADAQATRYGRYCCLILTMVPPLTQIQYGAVRIPSFSAVGAAKLAAQSANVTVWPFGSDVPSSLVATFTLMPGLTLSFLRALFAFTM